MKYRIGIDLGGSHIGAGLVDEAGKLLDTVYSDTPADREFLKTVGVIADTIEELLTKNGVTVADCVSVGIGSPGISDEETGNIVYSANFDWHDAPLRTELYKRIALPIAIANDADAAGWAEYCMGAGAGSKSCVTVTLGTGVGGGIVLGGKLFSGGMSGGGELGHVTLVADGRVCGCGKHGCAEAYCSATALIKIAQEGLGSHPESCLNESEKLDAKAVIDGAKAGDAFASEIFSGYVNHLAHLLASIINLLAPEVIALGGGVSKAGDFLFEPLRRRVDELVLNKTLPHARIVGAQMGTDAGIVGAALLEV
ncbi:MAG: ROK family protein [Clostridiales bacterium]|nr:ROK family protein [Clostridiales bacterium]